MIQGQYLFLLLVFFVVTGFLFSQPDLVFSSEIFYSFRSIDGQSGGVALVEVSEETGEIGSQTIICEDGRLALAKKVRFNKEAERIAITNEGESKPFVFLSKLDPPSLTGPAQVKTLCDELRSFGKSFIASCDKGLVVLFKGKDGREQETFRGRNISPPGNRPEDIAILKQRDIAVLSFQKDNSSGTKFGNRIVALSLPDLKLRGDVLIPRDHPELHVQNNPKLSGPGPEVLLVSEETNTVLSTLDFYGALAILDLDSLIKGKLRNYKSIAASLDGKWGTAFPDRVGALEVNGRHFALVTNAGSSGGTSLVDLKKREVVRRFQTPPGLEAPRYLSSCMVAVSVCSGKTKYRRENEIVKEYHPDSKFYIFDFSGNDIDDINCSVTSIGIEGRALIPVATESSPFVLVAAYNKLIVVNASDGTLVSEAKSIGIPQRFEGKE